MKKKIALILICALLATLSTLLMMRATDSGVGIQPDSITYINAARNIIEGNGYVDAGGNAITHFPPLYPLLLSVTGFFNMDPRLGAKGLHILLFSLNILALFLAMVSMNRERALLPPLLGALIILGSPLSINVFSMAMTESLFILLLIPGFALLYRHLHSPALWTIIAPAALFSLAFLTRYAALPFILCALISLWIFSKGEKKEKLKDIFTFSFISFFPFLLWILRNKIAGASATNRELVFHPPTMEHVKAAFYTFAGWAPPHNPRSALSVILFFSALIIFTGLLFYGSKKPRGEEKREALLFPKILLILAPLYLVFLFFSISLADAQIPMNDRILSPLFIFTVIAFVLLARATLRTKVAGISASFICIVLILFQFMHSYELAEKYGRGRLYSSKLLQKSDIFKFINYLPEKAPIYSNGADLISLYTGRQARSIPFLYSPTTRKNNVNFIKEMNAVMRELGKENAVLVYFKVIRWRTYLPVEKELLKNMKLKVLYKSFEGTIYRLE
ncbi:MAG: hypothetical protein OEV42_04105 [Deltaproteobacteria bacterium]|nr:hypothetical protein [Deltaproteobacteria bacterium]